MLPKDPQFSSFLLEDEQNNLFDRKVSGATGRILPVVTLLTPLVNLGRL